METTKPQLLKTWKRTLCSGSLTYSTTPTSQVYLLQSGATVDGLLYNFELQPLTSPIKYTISTEAVAAGQLHVA